MLEKKGLSNSEYVITKEVRLEEKARYYWRIKAVDGASNASEWTAPKLLYVDTSLTSRPGRNINIWAIGIPVGIGVIVLLLILAPLEGRKYR